MSISKVNIQEANSHLRKLHKKVFELENRIQMQALHVEELEKANSQLQHQLGTLTQKKAKEVGELSKRLQEAETHVQQLLESASERDSAVLKLEQKARLFYEVVEHRPAIARILEVLEELSVEEVEGSVDMEGKGVISMATAINGLEPTPSPQSKGDHRSDAVGPPRGGAGIPQSNTAGPAQPTAPASPQGSAGVLLSNTAHSDTGTRQSSIAAPPHNDKGTAGPPQGDIGTQLPQGDTGTLPQSDTGTRLPDGDTGTRLPQGDIGIPLSDTTAGDTGTQQSDAAGPPQGGTGTRQSDAAGPPQGGTGTRQSDAAGPPQGGTGTQQSNTKLVALPQGDGGTNIGPPITMIQDYP